MVPPSSSGVSRAPPYSNAHQKPFRLRGYHPLWLAFPEPFGYSLWPAGLPPERSAGLLRVRSPLLAESQLMSFPPGTEMFHFPGFAWMSLCIQPTMTETCSAGLPHSGIKGSTPVCGYPLLIAACHALHRLQMPRHPPCALSNLTDSKFSHAQITNFTTTDTHTALSHCACPSRKTHTTTHTRSSLLRHTLGYYILKKRSVKSFFHA